MPATPSEDARETRAELTPADEAAGEGELDGLADDAGRKDFFRRRPGLLRGATVESLCARINRLFGVDLEQARQLAATARWMAEALDDDASRALADRVAANVEHSLGENEQAQELYRAALARFGALDKEKEAAITRSSALLNLAFLGDYRTAFAWHAAAREVFERRDDTRRLAILEHNLGNVLVRQDRWDEALDCYSFAYEQFLELDRPQDVAICLRNIAVCHIHLHRFTEALGAYEQNRAYCRRHGLTRVLLQVDYNIAYLYYLRGEYTRAIRLYRQVRRDCEAAGDDYHQALCDLDQAEMFLDLNLVAEAEELATSAFTTFEQQKIPYETAKALTNGAIAASRRGRSTEALELLREARRIFVSEKNQLWPALIDFYQAVVLYREQRSREAESLARSALAIFSEAALAPRAAMCEILLADLLLDLERLDEARAVCREALGRLTTLELPALEHQAYLVLGQVEEALGDPQAALSAYRRSHHWLEKLRSQLQGEDLKIAFLKDKLAIYENLVWLTMHEVPTAEGRRAIFDYIESAKSRGLAELLAFRAHALKPRSPARRELAARVRALRPELNTLYRQIDRAAMRGGERSREEIRGLRSGIRSHEDELLRSLRELQVTDREFTSLQSGAMVDLETIRSSLTPDVVLVEYFIARGKVFACVVDRERLEIRELTRASEARELHRFLQFQLSKLVPGRPRTEASSALVEKATRAYLRELYEILIAPIRRHLDKPELIVVPHGFLHYVPFHALHDGEAYLVDELSISYAPSAGVFHLCAAKEATYEETSLVLGVADERAPHILEEVRTVAKSLPGATLLLGREASEEALKRHGTTCRFLHLATHGFFRRDNPMFSAIQLGTSRLSLFDLYDLRLSAELVVLSGCGTGLNAVLGADELVGLTRGWLYAGAHSVLVSLWDVNDASTAVFMRRFYEHLGRGTDRAQALRRTMRDVREELPHPYHWAPFVLVGKAAS